MPAATDRLLLPGSKRQAMSDARRLGPANPAERLTVSIQVRRRPDAPPLPDLAALGAQRPRDRERPDRESLAATHGADPADLAKVEDFARQYGLQVEESSAERRTILLSGTVDQMNQAFGVELSRYEYPGGTYRSREGHVRIPRHLQGVIERVSGLTDRPLARPLVRFRPRNVLNFPASRIAQLYNFPAGSDGSGVCIGIIELGGGYSQRDLDTYFGSVGLSTPDVVAVSVDGAANNYGDPSGADAEVELDIEVAGTIAPGATIAVYFAPNTEQGFIDAINVAIHDQNAPSVISISWGAPEDGGWTTAGLNGMDAAFAAAAAAGITVLAAAGDNGSNDGVNDGQAHCDFPASDPYVIACGGTTLQVDDSGALAGEVVWNDGFSGATGGGVSDVFPLPAWQAQAGVNVPPSVNDGVSAGRGVPDVTADADPGTGYDVIVDGGPMAIGGTSAVAPLYAGLLALIISAVHFPLGYITPYLYSLNGTNVFVDIVSGNNQIPAAPGYSAGVGWDACSGLGRIDGSNLLANV
jgi:kumamolisin